MSMTIRAHFDGKVIVPDEPLDLPANQSLLVDLHVPSGEDHGTPPEVIEERLRRLDAIAGRISGVPPIPLEALRREELYD